MIYLRREKIGFARVGLTGLGLTVFLLLTSALSSADCQGKKNTYTVKKDEVLSKVITTKLRSVGRKAKIFGDKSIIQKVFKLNPAMKDMNHIRPGSVVILPEEVPGDCAHSSVATDFRPAPPTSEISAECQGKRNTYTVKQDEVLSKVITTRLRSMGRKAKIFGDKSVMQKVLKLNPAIKDVNRIRPGTVVILPRIVPNECEIVKAEVATSPATPALPPSLPEDQTNQATAPIEQPRPSDTEPASSPAHIHAYSRNKVVLGLGTVLIDGLASAPSIPQFYLESWIGLSDRVDLMPMIRGFLPTYTASGASALEGQLRVGAGYRLLDDHLTLGLGAQYFTFGYSGATNSQGSSFDGILLLGTRFEPAPRVQIEAVLDARIPFTVMGASGDNISASPQFGGFGLLVEGRYLVTQSIFLGVYTSLDYINLTWTQSARSPGFNPPVELGAGFHVGWGF